MGEIFWREVLPDSLCKIPLAPITRLLKQQGPTPGAAPQCSTAPYATVWVAGLLYGKWSG